MLFVFLKEQEHQIFMVSPNHVVECFWPEETYDLEYDEPEPDLKWTVDEHGTPYYYQY